jgi:hypothetical protein
MPVGIYSDNVFQLSDGHVVKIDVIYFTVINIIINYKIDAECKILFQGQQWQIQYPETTAELLYQQCSD